MNRFLCWLVSGWVTLGVLTVSHAQRFVRPFDTITQLLASNPNDPHRTVQVNGLNTESDGEGGRWKWYPGDITATNTSTVFASTFTGAPVGRWKKINDNPAAAPPDLSGLITNYTTITVESRADLKAIDVTKGIQLVITEGYANSGDDGGGPYKYVLSGTSPQDGGIIDFPNNGAGYWERVILDHTLGYNSAWWGVPSSNGQIQAAINYANSTNKPSGASGGRVILPARVIEVKGDEAASLITIKSNVRLEGQPGTVLTIGSSVAPTNSYAVLTLANGATNWSISGVTIQGYKAAAPGASTNYGRLIDLKGNTNGIIERCLLSDAWTDGIYVGAHSSGNPSDDIQVIDTRGSGNLGLLLNAASVKNLHTGDRKVVDVMAFGADDTGTYDSTPAFNAALASFPGNNYIEVRVPPGTFKLNTTITNKQSIKGSGYSATTFLPWTNTLPVITVGSGIAGQFDEYMSLSDFSVGTYPASTWNAPCAIRIVGMLFSSIQNVWTRGGATNGLEIVVTGQTVSHSNIKNCWFQYPDWNCIYTSDSGATNSNFIHMNWDNVTCHSWNRGDSKLAHFNGGSFSVNNSHWQALASDQGFTNVVPHGVKVTKRTGFNFFKFNLDCDNHNDVLWDVQYAITFADGNNDAEFFTQTIGGHFEIAGYMNFLTNANWNNSLAGYNGAVNLAGWKGAESVYAIREGTVFNSIYIGDINEHTPEKIRGIGATGSKLTSGRRLFGEGQTNFTIRGQMNIADHMRIGGGGGLTYPGTSYSLEAPFKPSVFGNTTNPAVRAWIEIRKPDTNLLVFANTNAGFVFVSGNDYASSDATAPAKLTIDASNGLTNGLALLTSSPNAPVDIYPGGASSSFRAAYGLAGNMWFPRTAYFTADPIVTNAVLYVRSIANAEFILDSDTDNTATADSRIWFRQKGTNQFAIIQASNGNLNMLRYDDAGVLQDVPISISGSSGDITIPERVAIKIGSTSTTKKIGASYLVNQSAVGNTDAGEDDLMTTTIAANDLGSNGDSVLFRSAGTFAANANVKRVRAYLGATLVFDTGALAFNNTHFVLTTEIIRGSSATAQTINVDWSCSDSLLSGSANFVAGVEDLSTSLVYKLTGEATATIDIRERSRTGKWHSTP